MDHASFDELTQRIARQTTRRTALAALLGGALVLHAPDASEANDKAKRRKKRRRKQETRAARHRGIAYIIDNSAGTRSVVVGPGEICEGLCCAAKVPITVTAGGSTRIENYCATAWSFINRKYWFQVTNPLIGKPYLAIAHGGAFYGHNTSCCQGNITGTTIEYRRTFSEGQSVAYTIAGAPFTVTRNRDSRNHKVFTVKLPATL